MNTAPRCALLLTALLCSIACGEDVLGEREQRWELDEPCEGACDESTPAPRASGHDTEEFDPVSDDRDDPAFDGDIPPHRADDHTGHFVTTWATGASHDPSARVVTIPTGEGVFDYDIDWDGDGAFDEFGLTGPATHVYDAPGTYTVRIRGVFPHLRLAKTDRADGRLVSIDQWGTIRWESLEEAFAPQLPRTYPMPPSPRLLAADTPNLSRVRSMRRAFDGVSIETSSLEAWDVSSVEDMHAAFYNTSIGAHDLSGWDVSSVRDMSAMFMNATGFDGDVTAWDVSRVETMDAMFRNATSFDQDISGWDVSNVRDFAQLFLNATSFDQDISGWDTSSATSMRRMFYTAKSFSHDIGGWETSGVRDMTQVVAFATSFDHALGGWDLSSLREAHEMVLASGMSTESWDATLVGWASQEEMRSRATIDATGATYCEASAHRAQLTGIERHWRIEGDENACP